MRDSLSFARPNERKQRKGHPRYAPAAPVHCDARIEGMRPELAPLWRHSDMLAAPMLCIGHPSVLRFSPLHTGPNTKAAALSVLACIHPLGAARSSAARKGSNSRMSESRVALRVSGCSLAGEQRKESMRSIDAVQGAFVLETSIWASKYKSLAHQRETPSRIEDNAVSAFEQPADRNMTRLCLKHNQKCLSTARYATAWPSKRLSARLSPLQNPSLSCSRRSRRKLVNQRNASRLIVTDE